MQNQIVKKSYYLITVVLLLFAMAFVACDGAGDGEDTGVEPGLDTDDALATDVGVEDFEDSGIIDEEMATPEPVVEPTVMEVPTEEPIVEPTEEMAVEATPTVEVMATEDMTDTDTEDMTDTDTEGMTDADAMADIQAILASDLVGMDITNDDAEEVGEVSELLLNEDGTIAYALFDVGGFLGIADKTVAVSWDNFEIRHEDEVMIGGEDMDIVDDVEELVDVEEYTIVYTGVATDLENLPAFDAVILDQDGYVLDDMQTDAAEDATDTDIEFDVTPYVGKLQVGEFEDFNLFNMEDEDLGEVEDLIVDVNDGQVTYAIVDFGGFLGIAETSVALPWDQLALEQDTETFRLDVDAPTLESAPPFDFDTWNYPLEENWDADYKVYWEAV